jgi:glutathione S-transferase
MSFPIEVAVAGGSLREDRARLWAYVQRIRARPAYQRAVARGGPYDLSMLG